MKREWEWTARDRALFIGSSKSLARTPSRLARQIFQSIKAPHQMTSVQAGEVGAVHEETIRNVHRQQLVQVEGQTDILAMGLPYICPYNVNSIMNPILVMCLGLGYFFNLYRGKPLVREGGVLIMSHPTPWEFHPVHHPSYIDFFEQVLAETTDPLRIEAEFEKGFAEDEWYRHLYRTSYAYHGVHPFYMWYWGAHALQHLGRVIIVGGEPRAVRRLGFMPASTMNDALEMASDVVGPRRRRSPTCTSHPSFWPTSREGSPPAALDLPVVVRARCPRESTRYPEKKRTGIDYETEWARSLRRTHGTVGAARSRAPPDDEPARGTGPSWTRPPPRSRPTPTRPACHLRRQPPQPCRHAVAVVIHSGTVAPPHVRRCRCRLLLHVAGQVGGVGAGAERHPDRAHPRLASPGRRCRRAHRRGVEPGDLSRRAAGHRTAGASRSAAAPPISRFVARCPVVPVHIEGTGRILRKGKRRPARSATRLTFGEPLWPADGEDSRRFAVRIERAVAALADEVASDWYSARVPRPLRRDTVVVWPGGGVVATRVGPRRPWPEASALAGTPLARHRPR